MTGTRITHDSLIDAGFSTCIFAPIYLTKYSYFLGVLNYSKAIETEIIKPNWWKFWKKPIERKYTNCNIIDWGGAKMLIAISADSVSYIDYWTGKRFGTIEEIRDHCKSMGIEMKSSKT